MMIWRMLKNTRCCLLACPLEKKLHEKLHVGMPRVGERAPWFLGGWWHALRAPHGTDDEVNKAASIDRGARRPTGANESMTFCLGKDGGSGAVRRAAEQMSRRALENGWA